MIKYKHPIVEILTESEKGLGLHMKRFTVLLLSALLLTGCAKQETKDIQFENDMNDICDAIVEIDASINEISNETGDAEGLASAKAELLDCLEELNDEFRKFGNMDFPEEFDYLEEMADEASDYMTEAVNSYHKIYDTEDGYNVSMEEYANENYSRAYKRVRVILALLRGETPDEEGLVIQ